jgi:hypothetical protein
MPLTTTADPGLIPLLEAGLARISPPGAWTQGYYARNAAGNPVTSTAPEAVCWCAAGAIVAGPLAWWQAATRLLSEVVGGSLADWNDEPGRTQDEVLAVYREAIARCQA